MGRHTDIIAGVLIGFLLASRTLRSREQEHQRPTDDRQARALGVMLQQAQAELALNNDNIEAHDNKVYAFLALVAAVAGVLITARDALQPYWWSPMIGLAISAVLFASTLWPRKFDIGPDVPAFYRQWASDPEGFDAQIQMLTEITTAIQRNDRILPSKAHPFYAGAIALLLRAIIGGTFVGVTTSTHDHPGLRPAPRVAPRPKTSQVLQLVNGARDSPPDSHL